MLRLKRLICDKRGIGAIWTVVLLACLIPVFIFGFIDIPYYMRVNRKIKNTVLLTSKEKNFCFVFLRLNSMTERKGNMNL